MKKERIEYSQPRSSLYSGGAIPDRWDRPSGIAGVPKKVFVPGRLPEYNSRSPIRHAGFSPSEQKKAGVFWMTYHPVGGSFLITKTPTPVSHECTKALIALSEGDFSSFNSDDHD